MKIIAAISHIPILVAVILSVRLYHRLGNTLRVFSWFIFLSGAIQFSALALSIPQKNNMPLLHIYVAMGFPCLVLFYRKILGNFINIRIIWAVVLLFELFTTFNSLFIQGIFRFNSNALAVESVLIIIISLFTYIFFLNSTIKEEGVPDLASLKWINSGLFIYYTSCLMIFYFGDTILFRIAGSASRLTWVFHAFFSIVMYSCFIAGLWKLLKVKN